MWPPTLPCTYSGGLFPAPFRGGKRHGMGIKFCWAFDLYLTEDRGHRGPGPAIRKKLEKKKEAMFPQKKKLGTR